MSNMSESKSAVSPKTLLIYTAISFAVFYVWLLFIHQETVAYYFPYADDPTIYEQSEETFSFKAGCRDWGRSKLYQENREGDGYACGRRCTFIPDEDVYICDRISGIYTQ